MTHRHLTTLAAVLLLAAAGCGETRPATGAANDCSACHGFPPATLTAGGDHPQPASGEWVATDCAVCHFTSVDATTGAVLPAPEGTHADGKRDGKHADYTDPAVHGPAANAGIALCRSCHGTDLTGGTANYSCTQCHTGAIAFTNCTLCHGTRIDAYSAADLPSSAPPADVAGNIDVGVVTVGLHQEHVAAPSNPLGCGDCHAADGSTPADVFAAGHVDGGTAEVPFGPLATAGGASPSWDRSGATCSSTWCHDRGGSDPTPSWTTAGARTCGSCHPAQPTAAAHPAHAVGETLSNGFSCGTCHQGVGTYDASHLDGVLNVAFDNAPVPGGEYNAATGACSSTYCHGNFTNGNVSNEPTWSGTAACGSCHPNPPTSGKHTMHLSFTKSGDTRKLSCGDCHTGFTATAVDAGLHVNGTFDVPRIPTTACHPFGTGDLYGTSCDGRSDW